MLSQKLKILALGLFSTVTFGGLTSACSCSTPPGGDVKTNCKVLTPLEVQNAFINHSKENQDFARKSPKINELSGLFLAGNTAKDVKDKKPVSSADLIKNIQTKTWLDKNQFDNSKQLQSKDKYNIYYLDLFVTTGSNEDRTKPDTVILAEFKYKSVLDIATQIEDKKFLQPAVGEATVPTKLQEVKFISIKGLTPKWDYPYS